MVIKNEAIVSKVMFNLKNAIRSEGTNLEKAAQLIRDYRDIVVSKKNDEVNRPINEIINEHKQYSSSNFGHNTGYGLLNNTIQHSKSG